MLSRVTLPDFQLRWIIVSIWCRLMVVSLFKTVASAMPSMMPPGPKPEQWNASGSFGPAPTIRRLGTICHRVSDPPNQHMVSGRDVEIANRLSALARKRTEQHRTALAVVVVVDDGNQSSESSLSSA